MIPSPAQIRGARGLLGMTQTELAERAGMSATALVSIERGLSDPKASTVDSLRRALESSGIEFLGENGVKLKGPVG